MEKKLPKYLEHYQGRTINGHDIYAYTINPDHPENKGVSC